MFIVDLVAAFLAGTGFALLTLAERFGGFAVATFVAVDGFTACFCEFKIVVDFDAFTFAAEFRPVVADFDALMSAVGFDALTGCLGAFAFAAAVGLG